MRRRGDGGYICTNATWINNGEEIMYQMINFNEFYDAFQATRHNNFTYEGLQALFDFLEEFEKSVGEKQEFDMIAICCEYSEEPLEDALKNLNCEDLEGLEGKTTVINYDADTGLVLYQNH